MSGRAPAAGGARAARDRGSATVWAALTGCALALLAAAGSAFGAALVARHQAQAAADLGALAGARLAPAGAPTACEAATAVVRANHGHLVECRVVGWDAVVTVEMPVHLAGAPATVRAAARAGPVGTPADR